MRSSRLLYYFLIHHFEQIEKSHTIIAERRFLAERRLLNSFKITLLNYVLQ